ncbi:JAB domain-containing protein [Methanoculleus sp. FWC-SCC1]|uniref:JAB domain-containing protein n=1 Tax=Methanoculleus frigidifontis TaxID=2584085 RepID=A0ABT8MA34_9EURY|nr:DNA repair protein RadC [Methanoculleus sp. FWC-SCC1]MDN7024804.1 JAB domain-containing protein [Methanoculleus sp. FWC-SCC1]
MKRIRDLPDLDRPREKLAKRGAESLSEKELIAAIIGRGTRGRDVLLVASDISRFLKTENCSPSYDDLVEIEGVGAAKACQIIACFELARRFIDSDPRGHRIASPTDVLSLVTDLVDRRQEHFVCITLNGAGEVITRRTVTVGLLNQSLVHPREVFADAITDRAASVVLVHNHPSGNLEPSQQDIAITRQLSEAGSILGIRVLDHLIVSRKGYVSLKEIGHL